MTSLAIEIPAWLGPLRGLFESICALPLSVHRALTFGAAIASLLVMLKLGVILKEVISNPKKITNSQVSFKSRTLNLLYEEMHDNGTLHIFRRSQIIDLFFILSFGLLGIFLGCLLARCTDSGSWGQILGFAGAGFIATAAVFDLIEDLISFPMINKVENGGRIIQSVAFIYSTCAAIKWALIALGCFAFAASFYLCLYGYWTA